MWKAGLGKTGRKRRREISRRPYSWQEQQKYITFVLAIPFFSCENTDVPRQDAAIWDCWPVVKMRFDQSNLLRLLEDSDEKARAGADFGPIGLGPDHRVEICNPFDSRLAGLPADWALGRRCFEEVAPCTNNFRVAQRLESEGTLDAIIDYVFTVRMQPTPVQLRLLKHPSARRCIAVRRAGGGENSTSEVTERTENFQL